jgi:hypothetical protein
MGPAGPPGQVKLYITGEIEKYPHWSIPDSFYYDEDVYVANAEVIPSVKINNQELKWDGWFSYDGEFPLTSGADYNLVVAAGIKTATASVKLPGDFSITTPASGYVLPKGQSLNVSWNSASYADFYRGYLSINYSYRDTSGNYRYFYYSGDTILSGTSITYPSNLLFPNLSEIDSIRYGYGYFYVYAFDGPALTPGTSGNVTGDGIGFFWGKQARRCSFDVGNAKKTSKEDTERLRKEALKKSEELWKQRINSLKEGITKN